MIEIIETLNNTSPLRTIFYCLVFLFSLTIIFGGITSMVKYISRGSKKKNKPTTNPLK